MFTKQQRIEWKAKARKKFRLVESLKTENRVVQKQPPKNVYHLRVALMGVFSLEPHYKIVEVRSSRLAELEVLLRLFETYKGAKQSVRGNRVELTKVLRETAKEISHKYNGPGIWLEVVGKEGHTNEFYKPVGLKLTKFNREGTEYILRLPKSLQLRKS